MASYYPIWHSINDLLFITTQEILNWGDHNQPYQCNRIIQLNNEQYTYQVKINRKGNYYHSISPEIVLHYCIR